MRSLRRESKRNKKSKQDPIRFCPHCSVYLLACYLVCDISRNAKLQVGKSLCTSAAGNGMRLTDKMFFCGLNNFFRPFQTALPVVKVKRAECTQEDFIICFN